MPDEPMQETARTVEWDDLTPEQQAEVERKRAGRETACCPGCDPLPGVQVGMFDHTCSAGRETPPEPSNVVPFPTPKQDAVNSRCACGEEWWRGGAVVLDAATGSVTGRTVDDWRCASCGAAL